MMLSTAIRKVRIEDIDQILKIEQEAFPKSAYSREYFLLFAGRFPDTFLVVESGENIVGYIVFDMGGHILSMAVKAETRRKGLGTALFIRAGRSVQKRPWLEVRSKNRGAIAFYKRQGMKIIGRMPNYYRDDDALVMALDEKKWEKMKEYDAEKLIPKER